MAVCENAIEPKERTLAIGKAHAQVVSAKWKLEDAGVTMESVAGLSERAQLQFPQFLAGLTHEQANLLRDFLKRLVLLAEAMGSGEVDLSTIDSETLQIAVTNTGTVSYLHDIIDVVVSMKKLEANIESRKNAKFAEGLQTFRDIEERFEKYAGKLVEQFVA